VVALDVEGNPTWAYDLMGGHPDGVTIDGNGRVYVIDGYANGNKSHITGLSSSGELGWHHDIEGRNGTGNMRGVSSDGAGHVLATGRSAGAILVDGEPVGTPAGSTSSWGGYLICFEAATGAPLWAHYFESDAGEVEGYTVVPGSDGTFLVNGLFDSGGVNLGSGSLDNDQSGWAMYVGLLAPTK
jgi:hypothetical protein